MGRYHTLAIAGAIEEMACGGAGCPACPYAARPGLELACRIEIPGEPISLIRETLAEAGAEVPAAARGRIGRDADAGKVYGVEDLPTAIAALEAGLAALGENEELFNERHGLEASLRLFRIAQAHAKPVVLEV